MLQLGPLSFELPSGSKVILSIQRNNDNKIILSLANTSTENIQLSMPPPPPVASDPSHAKASPPTIPAGGPSTPKKAPDECKSLDAKKRKRGVDDRNAHSTTKLTEKEHVETEYDFSQQEAYRRLASPPAIPAIENQKLATPNKYSNSPAY